jgi:hypothetical protein
MFRPLIIRANCGWNSLLNGDVTNFSDPDDPRVFFRYQNKNS